MADLNIKKVTIPKEELPSIDGSSFSYNIRYRIVSDDKNRSSHWSRVYNLDAATDVTGTNLIPSLDYNYVKENANNASGPVKVVRLSWIIPVDYANFKIFDIFIKRKISGVWDASYSYLGTASTNNYTITELGTETQIQVLVQTPTYPKAISTAAKLFETIQITT